jgi:regulator of sigma D
MIPLTHSKSECLNLQNYVSKVILMYCFCLTNAEPSIIMNKISHSFLTLASEIIADSEYGLSGSEIVKYFNSKSVDYSVDIPHSKAPLSNVANKRTAFLENLERFSSEQQFVIIDELTQHAKLVDHSKVKELRQSLYNSYSKLSSIPSAANSEQAKKAEHFLQQFPDAHKTYTSALEKYSKKIYERNTLDDLRLSLEQLMRHILENSKSLENQLPELGAYQKAKGITPTVTNMFSKLLDYYSKYQNDNVKHDDKVKESEIDFVINLTTTFMLFLVK